MATGKDFPPDGDSYDPGAQVPTHGYLDGVRISLGDAELLDVERRQDVLVKLRSGAVIRPFRFATVGGSGLVFSGKHVSIGD